MVCAVYVTREILIFDEQSFNEVRKAFARGKLNFSHWKFIAPGINNEQPEIGKEGVNSILYLNVENDRITPFATDEEIYNMFLILVNERKPIKEIYTSNNYDQQIVSFDFAPIY